jgi:chromosome segregation and condensation protein ScpB
MRDGLLEIWDSLSKEAWERDNYRREAMIAVEGMAVTLELLAKALGDPIARKTDTEAWLKRYREAWLLSNKESELGKIEEQFRFLDTM